MESEFCFSGLGLASGSEFSFQSSGMLARSSAMSVYLPFLFLFTFGFPLLITFVLLLHPARCHACMDAQVGPASQVPPISYVRSSCSSSSSFLRRGRQLGSQDRFSIRSDQSNNQRKINSKPNTHVPFISLSSSDRLEHESSRSLTIYIRDIEGEMLM